MKTESKRSKQFQFCVDPYLSKLITSELRRAKKELPGIFINRSDVIRALLMIAFAQNNEVRP